MWVSQKKVIPMRSRVLKVVTKSEIWAILKKEGKMEKFIIPVLAAFFVQLFKFIKDKIRSKRSKEFIKWKDFLTRAGGMPSTHATFVSALSIGIGFSEGFNSSIFAVCAIFSLIVIADAVSLRKNVGEQAKRLNKIQKYLFVKTGHLGSKLPERIGHSFLEVLVGVIIGTGFALVARYFTQLF
ncbi:divergent PAP2 family protein [bacterium]|nr:divergent PAP2 family protein [bacterium]